MKENSMTHTLNVHEALNSWGKAVEKANAILKDISPELEIDEIALIFRDAFALGDFLSNAVREDDVVLFNSAVDKVHTSPLCTDYQVSYFFFTTPIPGVRLEAMVLNSGFSPLHQARLMEMEYPGSVVHLSFKVPDEQHYEEIQNVLGEMGWYAQGCASDYGRFSYYKVGDLWSENGIYLKPRVNLRDDEKKVAEEAEEFLKTERGDFGMPHPGSIMGDFVDPATKTEGDK